jgi:hypothetical protein
MRGRHRRLGCARPDQRGHRAGRERARRQRGGLGLLGLTAWTLFMSTGWAALAWISVGLLLVLLAAIGA